MVFLGGANATAASVAKVKCLLAFAVVHTGMDNSNRNTALAL